MSTRKQSSALRTHVCRGWIGLALVLGGTLAAVPAAATVVPGAPRDGWARYEVPLVEASQGPCCYHTHGGSASRVGCDLDRTGGMFIQNGESLDAAQRRDPDLAVFLHFSSGRIDDVRAYGASCPVRAAKDPVAVSLQPAQSAGLLAQLARGDGEAAEGALVALAHHAGTQATDLMVDLLDSGNARSLRRDAVFWLGQLRGEQGAVAIERIAREDDDADLREHAVFSMSQARHADTFAIIADIAVSDASGEVRAKALFWLAQMDDPKAAGVITRALREDPSSHVREQAVFALSQLDEGGDQALIDVVRGDFPRGAKKKALFWLGQSGSDEALEFLDGVLAAD